MMDRRLDGWTAGCVLGWMVGQITRAYFCSQAERFDGLVHSFMERLAEAERVLKYGVIPEEEDTLRAFHKQHKVSKV